MRSLMLVGALTLALSQSAVAGPLDGSWSLNVPPSSLVPTAPTWTFVEDGSTFTGETSFTVTVSGFPVPFQGAMTGRKIFGPIYQGNASITTNVPGLPLPSVSVTSLMLVQGSRIRGFAVPTVNNVPAAFYQLNGTKQP